MEINPENIEIFVKLLQENYIELILLIFYLFIFLLPPIILLLLSRKEKFIKFIERLLNVKLLNENQDKDQDRHPISFNYNYK